VYGLLPAVRFVVSGGLLGIVLARLVLGPRAMTAHATGVSGSLDRCSSSLAAVCDRRAEP
jgi:hypothetical protein